MSERDDHFAMKKCRYPKLRSMLNDLIKLIQPETFGWNRWFADLLDADPSQLRRWRRGDVLPAGKNWIRFVSTLAEMGAGNLQFLKDLEALKKWISETRKQSLKDQIARSRRTGKSQSFAGRHDQGLGPSKAELAAWSEVDSKQLYRFVASYYKRKGISLFAYPGAADPVPLYVRPSWLTLTDRNLVMKHSAIERGVSLAKTRRQFLDRYASVRKALGQRELWDGRVFRLVKLQSSGNTLSLHFEHGRFFDALACQYILEHEARLVLAGRHQSAKIKPRHLPIREALAPTVETIERFCQTQAARIGISNFLLFRSGKDTYRPMIRSRGTLSMGQTGVIDTIGSGIFDIANGDASIDFELKYKILKELYEELLGGTEVEAEISQIEPDFFFRKPGIKELLPMLKDGRASFQVTGFCIDLIRIVPEITTILVVRDSKYFNRYRDIFRANSEYEAGSPMEIPRKVNDVEEYLSERFPLNPGRNDSRVGFDPSKWSLPGGFCFYQGIKKAFQDRLL